MGIWICRPRAQGREVRECLEEKRACGEMKEWPERWGRGVVSREEGASGRREVIVSNTDESSNQTGFVWLLDLVRGRLFF